MRTLTGRVTLAGLLMALAVAITEVRTPVTWGATTLSTETVAADTPDNEIEWP
ncbi:hypothetical protein [Streptomyces sp. SAI-229]|jgi:hypothetical protein|uniref:hypothetical protein n=1 Tax=Streptomyces sp. SAI-229 TaxID=3377731 RepID=UPI003C7A27E8